MKKYRKNSGTSGTIGTAMVLFVFPLNHEEMNLLEIL